MIFAPNFLEELSSTFCPAFCTFFLNCQPLSGSASVYFSSGFLGLWRTSEVRKILPKSIQALRNSLFFPSRENLSSSQALCSSAHSPTAKLTALRGSLCLL